MHKNKFGIEDTIRKFVWISVWMTVGDSVRNSVWASVRNSVADNSGLDRIRHSIANKLHEYKFN